MTTSISGSVSDSTPASQAGAETSSIKITPSTSPVPPSQPSPLTIGKTFVRQFYQVLSSSPEHIFRFYKPTSLLSHSLEASTITEPVHYDDGKKTSFFKQLGEGLCFDLKRGAIDAQETVNGGILLVVTGHLTLPGKGKPRQFVHTFFLNNGAPPGRKRQFYVHNDILRLLAVDEDDEVEDPSPAVEEEVTSAAGETTPLMSDAPEEVVETEIEAKDKVEEEEAVKVEETIVAEVITPSPEVVSSEQPPKSDEVAAVEPEVSESKPNNVNQTTENTETPEETVVAAVVESSSTEQSEKTNKSSSKKGKQRGRGQRNRGSRSSSPNEKAKNLDTLEQQTSKSSSKQQQKTASKPKGSWASLVAGGAAPVPKPAVASSSVLSSVSAPLVDSGAVEESKENLESMDGIDGAKAITNEPEPTTETKENKHPPRSSQSRRSGSSNDNKQSTRIPDATLFIKNVPDRTKEPEIRALFEPYAAKSSSKILGITLVASRGFCFVDFSDKEAVTAIVHDHTEAKKEDNSNDKRSKGAFVVHGRALDVERKVAVENKRGNNQSQQRSFRHRSSSPGNGAFHGKSGGQSQRRKTSPRGNRGGNRGGQQQNAGNK